MKRDMKHVPLPGHIIVFFFFPNLIPTANFFFIYGRLKKHLTLLPFQKQSSFVILVNNIYLSALTAFSSFSFSCLPFIRYFPIITFLKVLRIPVVWPIKRHRTYNILIKMFPWKCHRWTRKFETIFFFIQQSWK